MSSLVPLFFFTCSTFYKRITYCCVYFFMIFFLINTMLTHNVQHFLTISFTCLTAPKFSHNFMYCTVFSLQLLCFLIISCVEYKDNTSSYFFYSHYFLYCSNTFSQFPIFSHNFQTIYHNFQYFLTIFQYFLTISNIFSHNFQHFLTWFLISQYIVPTESSCSVPPFTRSRVEIGWEWWED